MMCFVGEDVEVSGMNCSERGDTEDEGECEGHERKKKRGNENKGDESWKHGRAGKRVCRLISRLLSFKIKQFH